MDIRQIKLSEIKPYWRNPRKNEGAISAVRKSIEEFGFNVPIVVDKDYVIIAGHTRYQALNRMGIELVDCIVSDMTPEKAKEFRIVDNASAEIATWDTAKLIAEIKAVGDYVDLKSLGFNEVDRILQMSGGTQTPDYDAEMGYTPPGSEEGLEEDWEVVGGSSEDEGEGGGGFQDVSEEPVEIATRMGVSTICPCCAEEFFLVLEDSK